jgi:hypothetical protein
MWLGDCDAQVLESQSNAKKISASRIPITGFSESKYRKRHLRKRKAPTLKTPGSSIVGIAARRASTSKNSMPDKRGSVALILARVHGESIKADPE